MSISLESKKEVKLMADYCHQIAFRPSCICRMKKVTKIQLLLQRGKFMPHDTNKFPSHMPLIADSYKDMAVSKNRGTPKSSILIGFSLINHPFWGTPIFGNTHILQLFHFSPNQLPSRVILKASILHGISPPLAGHSPRRTMAARPCPTGCPNSRRWRLTANKIGGLHHPPIYVSITNTSQKYFVF